MSYVGRVTQLDALTLDNELEKLLKNEFLTIGTYFNFTEFMTRWRHELDLLIQVIIWKFSTFDKGWTIGQKLLGIKYFTINRRGLIVLFILESVIPYLRQRFSKTIPEKLERCIDPIFKFLKIMNFCLFLLQNDYPSLSLRLISLKMVSEKLNSSSVGYSYQIRELLWHQLTDFLLIALPLVNIQRIKKYWKQFRITSASKSLSKNQVQIVERSRENKCCICGQEPFAIPQFRQNCVFCYYCISSKLVADPDYECENHVISRTK